MDAFVILTEMHIGVIYRILLMIEPDPSTPIHRIRVLWGSLLEIKQDNARRWRHFEHDFVWTFTSCARPCIVMSENVWSVILLND